MKIQDSLNQQALVANQTLAAQVGTDASSTKLSENGGLDRVDLSDPGKAMQKIDALSQKVDDILTKHVSADQKSTLNGLFDKLESLGSKRALNAQDVKKEDALLESVHKIMDSAYQKLSGKDRQIVDTLTQKIDSLSEKLGAGLVALEKKELQQQGAANRNVGSPPAGAQASETKPTGQAGGAPAGAGPAETGGAGSGSASGMTTEQLRKLPAHKLSQLNAKQLNQLTVAQMNQLSVAQLKLLTPDNVAKLDPQVQKKLAS